MDPGEARTVLGIDAGASREEIRAAYRTALRDSHPDLHGGDGGSTRAVIDAYRALVAAPPAPTAAPTPSPETVAPTPSATVVVEGDTVAADLPAGDLFAMLQEVGHRIGEVAYVDRAAGLLEIVVTFVGFGACSVVLSLQGRGTGVTEAFCTVEPLGTGPAPPAELVAALLGDGLRSLG